MKVSLILVGCKLDLLDEDYHMSRVHMMVPINGIRRVKWKIWVLVLGLELNVPIEKLARLNHLHCRFLFLYIYNLS